MIIEMIINIFTNLNTIFYILAYLSGGIPFGFLIVKIFYKIDIRRVGSGSIGATNVYRTLKDITSNAKKISILTILLDSTKGMIIVALAKFFGLSYDTQWAIATLAVLGHCYSPYLNFTGGKGVATIIGSTILLIPIEGVIGLIVWVFVGKTLKVSSLSSLIGVSCGILSSFILPIIYPSIINHQTISIEAQIGTHVPLVILLILIIYTHIPNIIRLFKKEEGKIL